MYSSRYRLGRRAEQLVCSYLVARGYQIVATNLRLGYLEIDIVARRRELVVVVEVRSRAPGSWTTGFGSILPAKRRRVRCAAERLWRRRYATDATVRRLRIDAAAVYFEGGNGRVHYCCGAF